MVASGWASWPALAPLRKTIVVEAKYPDARRTEYAVSRYTGKLRPELPTTGILIMDDFESWILLHGIENAYLFPQYRESKHLDLSNKDYCEAVENEWLALREYFREEADAMEEARLRIKRAGERYLWMLLMGKAPRPPESAVLVDEVVEHNAPVKQKWMF